ncbi:MAG: VWA domain-containing protein [Xanthomonadales bacterium]|nr:VWA domain-containing protein [Gammaproteobacteria bacterium]MBT8054821.1 VWA domain-containing protein [Gammaproteobacteria bacterium]NND58502.1 VWA domain-containing protein [Xanthomonadales bacterium]NNK51086.1 VWA domain-containing protein [Xanthomonadales bacterium]
MRRPNRETSVFSTSAIDLFASALGAFILLVMILFPYYRNAGDDAAFSRTLEIQEMRRLASGEIARMLAEQQVSQSEIQDMNEANRGIEEAISRIRKRMADIKTQLAETPVPKPEPVEEIIEEPEPEAVTAGVEFSILGLASEAKSFVIVVDMSGSMLSYTDLMIKSVLEVLEPLDDSNEFAIIGYQGNPSPVLWTFPDRGGLVRGTADNLDAARGFIQSLARRFAGSTPTHYAVMSAMQYPAKSIILMSDGEPDNAPGFIIQDITGLNRFENKEIHTVAIGDYTQNRGLVMFLQTLARQNGGDFVGVSR